MVLGEGPAPGKKVFIIPFPGSFLQLPVRERERSEKALPNGIPG
jgi:hypothetical protein